MFEIIIWAMLTGLNWHIAERDEAGIFLGICNRCLAFVTAAICAVEIGKHLIEIAAR